MPLVLEDITPEGHADDIGNNGTLLMQNSVLSKRAVTRIVARVMGRTFIGICSPHETAREWLRPRRVERTP